MSKETIKRVKRTLILAAIIILTVPAYPAYAQAYEPEPGFYEFLANFVSQHGYQKVYKTVYEYYKNLGYTGDSLQETVTGAMNHLTIDADGLTAAVRNTFDTLETESKNKLLSVYAAATAVNEGGGGSSGGSGASRQFEAPVSLPESIENEFRFFDNDFFNNSNINTAFAQNGGAMDFETFENTVITPLLTENGSEPLSEYDRDLLKHLINTKGSYLTLVNSRYKMGSSEFYLSYMLQGEQGFEVVSPTTMAQDETVGSFDIFMYYYRIFTFSVSSYGGYYDVGYASAAIEGKVTSIENYYVTVEGEGETLQEAVTNNYFTSETVNNEYVYIDNRNYGIDPEYLEELLKIIEGEKKGDVVNITINNYYNDGTPADNPGDSTGELNEETRGFFERIISILEDIANTAAELPNKVFHVNVDNFDEIPWPNTAPEPDDSEGGEGIWGFIKAVIDFIGDIIGGMLGSLFTLPENYMSEHITARQSRLAEKINMPEEYVQALLSIDGSSFGDIRGSASELSRSVSGSIGSGFDLGAVVNSSTVFVDFSFLREHISVIRGWISGIFGFFIFCANLDHVYFLIRKAHIFRRGTK